MNNAISQFLQQRIDAGDFPSAVYLVAEKGEIVFQDALGFAVVDPERIEAKVDTIYDLASLTKPLVTGLLCAQLIERRELELGRAIDYYLPEFQAAETAWDTSINELLAHISLFPAWKPFYLFVGERGEVLAEIFSSPMSLEGPVVVYSDLNFLVLTFIVEKILGERLDVAAKRKIFDRLGLNTSYFNPTAEKKNIAASEKGNEYEKQTCIELGYLNPPATIDGSNKVFRDYQIWGEVHDGNAWFMGGVAGHAGLFSTVGEVFKIAQQFLPRYTALLKHETCELFRTNFTKGMNEDRSIAFQLASTAGSTAGGKMSPESFGHNGFTGTSLWIDPVKDRIFVLLTNRTHAHTLPFININSVRRRFHDVAVEQLEAK